MYTVNPERIPCILQYLLLLPLSYLYIYIHTHTLDQKNKTPQHAIYFSPPLGAWRATKTFRYSKVICSLPFPIKGIKLCEFRGDTSARPVISISKINQNCRHQGQIEKVKEEGDEEESKLCVSQLARPLLCN